MHTHNNTLQKVLNVSMSVASYVSGHIHYVCCCLFISAYLVYFTVFRVVLCSHKIFLRMWKKNSQKCTDVFYVVKTLLLDFYFYIFSWPVFSVWFGVSDKGNILFVCRNTDWLIKKIIDRGLVLFDDEKTYLYA